MVRLALSALLGLSSLAQAGSLVPGNPDQIVQSFDDDGTLLAQTTWRLGRKAGRHVAFWPGGAPRVEAFYAGDMIEGAYRSWHQNGQLAELKNYVEGREAGSQRAWTAQGELFLNYEARNGRHYGLINSKPCLPVQGGM